MNENLDIYICTHKDFEPIVKNLVYKQINCNDINNDTWNGIKGSFYSEIMSYFYVAKNYPLKDYIGFCHYRKYWRFLDDIPNMDEAFTKCDAIVAKPIEFRFTISQQYNLCHNIEDLEIVGNIINEKFSDYSKAFDSLMKSHKLFPYNMFIMKKEDFLEYVDFMSSVLDEYVKIVGKDINKRIEDNKDKYLKKFYPNNTVDYQFRIAGYLAERLTHIFIITKFKKVMTYGVILTEKKYNKIN